MNFDFDAWARLAKENPQEFERQREHALRAAIEGASPQHRERLEAMQDRIDGERKHAQTPLASCARINSLMWAGFFRLRKELGKLDGKGAPAPLARSESAPLTTARVIPLRSRFEQPRIAQKAE